MDKVKRPDNQRHWLLRGLSQLDAFQFPIHSQSTVLGAVTRPLIKRFSRFLWKLLKFIHKNIWNTLDQSCFKNFSNHIIEKKLLSI